MAVIRQATLGSGIKRLGDIPAMAVTSPPAAVEPGAAAPDPEAVRASLAAAFADELEELRALARREGLLTAEAEIEGAVQQRVAEIEREARAQEEARGQAQDAALASLQAVAGALQEQMAGLRAEAEAAALEIAYQSVLCLLGAVESDRGVVAPLVAQAIRQHRLTGPLTLAVVPSQVERLQSLSIPGLELAVQADVTLAPGACRLAFGEGRVDVDLGAQLEQLRAAFLAALER